VSRDLVGSYHIDSRIGPSKPNIRATGLFRAGPISSETVIRRETAPLYGNVNQEVGPCVP
jgi:hypothetical protein